MDIRYATFQKKKIKEKYKNIIKSYMDKRNSEY